MRNFFLVALLILTAGACGKKEAGSELATKTAELAKLKKQQASLANQIAELEAKLVQLDPSLGIQPKLISVAEIAPEGFEAYINLQGAVNAENISYVAPRNGMGGYVKELFLKEGQAVKKGQLILKLDDQILRQSIESTKTQLAFAQNIYNRTKALWDQKIGTEIQLLNAKNNVDALKNQIAIQEEQLKTYLVYADQSGIAEVVNIKVGELFSGMGPLGPQIEIINNSELSVKVNVPENYAANVRAGTEVLIEIPAVKKTFKSTIFKVSQSVNAASVGFLAECKIPATEGLKPNMLASVRILSHSNAKAIVVPVNVVQSDDKGKYVYLMKEESGKKISRKVAVTLGELYGVQVEILQGLQPGDLIVTRGYQDLYDGQLVKDI